MKSKILLYCLLLIAGRGFSQSSSQSVTALQYYYNTDPGIGNTGNGGIIPVTPRANLDSTFGVKLPNSLSNGFNTLYVRARDEDGHWSITRRQSFFIQPTYGFKLTAYQYYFDTDPGVGNAGNGAIVSITDTSNIDSTLAIVLPNSLSPGFHHLYVRVKDTQGKWSIVRRSSFLIQPTYTFKIDAYQYYFDNDPGVGVAGNGAVVEINDTNALSGTMGIKVPLTLSNGFHQFYMRVRDSQGKWSITDRSSFYIQTLANTKQVAALEYYFDNDPGVGSANPIAISSTDDYRDTLNFGVPCLSVGTHYLYVRAQDKLGRWSIIKRDTIEVQAGLASSEVSPAGPIAFCSSSSVTLSALESDDFTYQWLKNGTPIQGATSHTLTVTDTGSYSLKSTCGNGFVTSNVVRVDRPSLNCLPNQLKETDNNSCTYKVVGSEFDPTSSDGGCTSSTLRNDFNNSSSLADAVFNKGTTTVVWTLKYGPNDSTNCSFDVKIEDNENPTISCAGRKTRSTNNSLCSYETVGNEFDPISFADNCPGVSIENNYNDSNTLGGEVFPKGTTTVTWTVIDASGNTANCIQVVEVLDDEKPSLSCLSTQVRNANTTNCRYTVSGTEFDISSSSDNCGSLTLKNDYNNSSSLAGAFFNSGTTAVTWTATDPSGNSQSCSFDVEVYSPVGQTISVTEVSCKGELDGGLTVTGINGKAPYTYLWNYASSTTASISGLSAGTYSVTVTDANGCQSDSATAVIEPDFMMMFHKVSSYNSYNISCKGSNNGWIETLSLGGRGAHTYLWSDGATAAKRSGLTAGAYRVTATDINGCSTSSSISLTEPSSPLTVNAVLKNISCNSGSDGSIGLTASGGSGTLSYSWSNGASTATISNLKAGTYIITITGGCLFTQSYTITEPDALSLDIDKVVDVLCYNKRSGKIQITSSGGTGSRTYQWLGLDHLGNAYASTKEDLTRLRAGTYTVSVTDDNSCITSGSATVSQPDKIVLTYTRTPASCYGGSDGAIDLIVDGGTPAYSYAWSNGSSAQDPSALSAGAYTVSVSDANNCLAKKRVVVKQPKAALTYSGSVTDAECGKSNGKIVLTTSGGTGTKTFSWSNSKTTKRINRLAAATYSVTVSDINNCSASGPASFIVGNGCSGGTPKAQMGETAMELYLYPNPTKGVVQISSNIAFENSKLEVLDVLGNLIISKNINGYSTTLDLAHVSQGIYLVRIEHEGQIQTKRLIVD